MSNKVLVIGDLLIDENIFGEITRLDPAWPVPIVKYTHAEYVLGGAGNVAANCATLGADDIHFATITGEDNYLQKVNELVSKFNIKLFASNLPKTTTIRKQRIFSNNHLISRIDFDQPLDNKKLINKLENLFKRFLYDIIVISDYGKGTISPELLNLVKKEAFKTHAKIFVDSKFYIDVMNFKNCYLMTPNIHELYKALKLPFPAAYPSIDTIVEKAKLLIEQLNLKYLIVTLGEKGSLTVSKYNVIPTQPLQVHQVFDLTGAGDTFISSLAVYWKDDEEIKKYLNIATTAAGISVTKTGSVAVTLDSVNEVIESEYIIKKNKPKQKLLSIAAILKKLNKLDPERNKTILTNGCFDLLHDGHLKILDESAKLNGIVIVAINDDQSVKNLKGLNRPIQTANVRAQQIAKHPGVDFVCVYNGDTTKLVETIKPFYLVKGAEYYKKNIPGSYYVLSRNGKVVLVEMLPNISTTIKIKEKEYEESNLFGLVGLASRKNTVGETPDA